MPRFRAVIPVDDYVPDVLMRDIVGHDRQPAAYLVYLYLYTLAARANWRPVPASLRMLADSTFEKRRSNRAGIFAPSGANRHQNRTGKQGFAAPCSAPLAQVNGIKLGPKFRGVALYTSVSLGSGIPYR